MIVAQRSSSRRMRELRTSFFEERKRLDADPATRAQAVC